jgi:hypothetical protein
MALTQLNRSLKKMALFPRDNMVLRTEMIPSEVSDVLRKNTKASRSWLRSPDETFFGHVDSEQFTITRVLKNYQNSFVPQMSGVISPENSGSRIDVRLTLLPFVRLFMMLWFGFLFVVGPICVVAGIIGFMSGKVDGVIMLVVPVIMLIFGLLLTHGAFRFEVPRSKRSLREVLSATEINSEQGVDRKPDHVAS